MEHHLDEAFGYYGAARKFHDFTDEEVAGYQEGLNYKDNLEEDGKIDFKTEYNFTFARLAAGRDLDAKTDIDFSRTIFDAFFRARSAIVDKNYDQLLEEKVIILDNWEKVIAATAIHHINRTIDEMEKFNNTPNESPKQFYKHWASMFKFTEMLRYSYANRLLQYEEILTQKYVTANVPYPKAIVNDPTKIPAYKTSLLSARSILQETYAFDDSSVNAW